MANPTAHKPAYDGHSNVAEGTVPRSKGDDAATGYATAAPALASPRARDQQSKENRDPEGCDSDSEPDDCEEGHRFSMDETVVIFDWDDTVLPSSWVQDQGLSLSADSVLTPEQEQVLAELARCATKTMRVARTLGTIVLVTNAERGWVELSCMKFLPSLYPSLESVKIISARTEYETPTTSSPFDWKLKAFTSEIERVLQSDTAVVRKNILSIGDSSHERAALVGATSTIPNCRIKSLKFVERPTVDQLCKEHLLLGSCFRRVVHHEGNLDLCIRPL